MSRVLIWKNISPGSEYDIFRQTDCITQYEMMRKGGTFNVGNRLWLQGIVSAIDTKQNEYSYLTKDMTSEMINSSFDFIVLPMANIFNEKFSESLKNLAETFAKIHIPVYVIACGAQADNYDQLDDLVNQIGELSKKFISAIYATGGEFALRGYFTKEFFERLGFTSAVVTGCPSLYQFGRNFQLNIPKAKKDFSKPIFNGKVAILEQLFNAYPQSVLMDQDVMLHQLMEEKADGPTLHDAFSFFCNFDAYSADLLAQDRICLIPDMYNWRTFLKEQQFDFSFGSRIHGNIMAVLSGIPAVVVAIDTRTMEMADFFKIPHIVHQTGNVYTKAELESIYASMDYTQFNECYAENFDRYAAFLVDHGIVSHVNPSNDFFDTVKEFTPPISCRSTSYYARMAKRICNNRYLFQIIRKLRFGF